MRTNLYFGWKKLIKMIKDKFLFKIFAITWINDKFYNKNT